MVQADMLDTLSLWNVREQDQGASTYTASYHDTDAPSPKIG